METSTGVLSQKPLFEAFQIGAWWDTKLLKKKGNTYVVYFEGYGKHEQQKITPEYIRLRSRKAENSDCGYLTLGADVVAFVVHPHSSCTESIKNIYSAWYDVKIISKARKHFLHTCACKFTVQFYSDLSRKSTRALLEGAVVEVSINEIAIMQAALDSPLEILFEKSLTLGQEGMKKLWSKDNYTLNLSRKPLHSMSANEDARSKFAAAQHDIGMIDLTENLKTDFSLGDVGTHHDLSKQQKPANDAGLNQEVCLPDQVTGRKRKRTGLPRQAKVTDTGIYAGSRRKRKESRKTVFNSESSFYTSDESSSSCKLSSSSHDLKHACHEEVERIECSESRSTPIFYGNEDEGNSIGKSLDCGGLNQGEDHGSSTSTGTFYGNTTDRSELSSSTAIFYGSCENEVDNLSTAEDTLNFTKASIASKHLPVKIPYIEHNNEKDADSTPNSCEKGDPAKCHEVDEGSKCFCNIVQVSSDHSQSVCRACKSLQGEDCILLTTTASSQGESLKKTKAVTSNIYTSKNVGETHACSSGLKSERQLKVLKKQKKNEVRNKQKRKFVPPTTHKRKNSEHGRHFQPKSCASHNMDRSRFSKTQEGKRNFSDLFDAILKSVCELARAKMTVPSEQSFSSIEDMQNRFPWDPIIFHESTGVCKSDLVEDVPLQELWKDMELAFGEMRGAAVLEKQHHQQSQDKASACEHDPVLDEQEGYICSICGLVLTSIENVLPPVMQEEANRRDCDNMAKYEKEAASGACTNGIEPQKKPRGPFGTDMSSVWKPIQDLRPFMHKNQVDGFTFLWKNIGALGSLTDTKGGGCIVAHAPGTGKSLLVISFLKSFLHLHSWCRPLIVAPKNMLLSWKKEFEKWKAGIKVYLLQASSSLTYLNVISDWQKNTSVMIVNYQLFSQLSRACKTLDGGRAREIQRIGSLLLHIPDILVLDEGHVPRNCSKLRESLLQIRTRFKVLVSGTLFQNNVQELFNLLYLARPTFLSCLQTRHSNERFSGSGLDKNMNNKQWLTFEEFDKERGTRVNNDEAELRLRKIFMEEIGNKLEGKVQEEAGRDEDFRHAIGQLQAIMAPFIHFYNGDILNSLPGINEFIVVLQATDLQMSLSKEIKQQTFLETALSIHPSLLLQWKGAQLPTYLDRDELHAIRGDATQGPKVKFILDLAECCHLLKEKLLIFSQFIKTMELVEEVLPRKFKVAMIKGKDKLEERQRAMEEFNEPGGTSILLASLTACGEGINLTGASRVVFLDIHWNPARMKQAVARAFRIGQKRVVCTYWLIASIEKEAEKLTRIHRKDWLSRSIFSLGTEFGEGHHKESHPNVEVEDYVLAQLVKNDASKCILNVVNYSASDRRKASAFFENCGFSGK